jgi:GH24 family phage-related lysozyme (muramidase)
LQAYPDPLSGGLPITIGWGSYHANLNGISSFSLGDKDIHRHKLQMMLLIFQIKNEFLPKLSKIPYWSEMSDGKRGALLSFAYNLGASFYGSGNFNTITEKTEE